VRLGVSPRSQLKAIRHHEVDIRNLIFNITTFTRTEDQRCRRFVSFSTLS